LYFLIEKLAAIPGKSADYGSQPKRRDFFSKYRLVPRSLCEIGQGHNIGAMVIRLTKPAIAAATAVCIFLLIAGSHAQVAAPLSQVSVTVVDQSGAVIAEGEVLFKSDSKTIVSRTGKDGSVTVTLPSGQYAVTASHNGFLKNNVPDFQVVAPATGELKVVLMVDPHSETCGGPVCGCSPCPLITITSDLPNVKEDEPSPVPAVKPATKSRKSRSLHCLYLWKCSTS